MESTVMINYVVDVGWYRVECSCWGWSGDGDSGDFGPRKMKLWLFEGFDLNKHRILRSLMVVQSNWRRGGEHGRENERCLMEISNKKREIGTSLWWFRLIVYKQAGACLSNKPLWWWTWKTSGRVVCFCANFSPQNLKKTQQSNSLIWPLPRCQKCDALTKST